MNEPTIKNPYPANSVMSRHFDRFISMGEAATREVCHAYERSAIPLSHRTSAEHAEYNAAITALYVMEEATSPA